MRPNKTASGVIPRGGGETHRVSPIVQGRRRVRYRAGGILLSFLLLFMLALPLTLLPAGAATQTASFDEWLATFRTEALSQGISETTLDAALADIAPIPRVIELDRRQPEFTMTLDQYMSRVVSRNRIAKARKLYRENRVLLAKIQKTYGVPSRVIVALWGIESDFGRLLGSFGVIPSLATLAYDGRRGAYFRKELLNALKILDQKHITLEAMKGSWAGAMGQVQFMPSSFLNFAVDFSGDGRKDLWGTRADIFASAANYLSRSGWNPAWTWGREVKLPPGFVLSEKPKKTRKILAEWQELGVRRADGTDLPKTNLRGAVIRPGGKDGPAYLVYGNFHVILKWNRSNFFALAVGHLSDALRDLDKHL